MGAGSGQPHTDHGRAFSTGVDNRSHVDVGPMTGTITASAALNRPGRSPRERLFPRQREAFPAPAANDAGGRPAPHPASATRTVVRTCGPSPAQLRYLRRGLERTGGCLPLFDDRGQVIPAVTTLTCIEKGWAEQWSVANTLGGLVMARLTAGGQAVLRTLEDTDEPERGAG